MCVHKANDFADRDKYMKEVTVGRVEPHNSVVTLKEYDPNWPMLFEREAERISKTLGDKALKIEHVGSTSVPSLCAKPIIDILLVVADSSDELSYVPEMERAGYILRIREPDWFQHRLFKGPDTDINLHVFSQGASEIERMIGFRDWLRNHDEDRHLYETTKRELACRIWEHVQHYADAKTEVIQEIMSRA